MKHLLFFAFLFSSGSVLAAPVCTGANSDADGDGWGWENDASCQVRELTAPLPLPPTVPATTSENSVCQFPGISDGDGDGFGWENRASCTVAEIQPTPSKGNAMSQLMVGQWNCTKRYVRINLNEITNAPSGTPNFDIKITDWAGSGLQEICNNSGRSCGGGDPGWIYDLSLTTASVIENDRTNLSGVLQTFTSAGSWIENQQISVIVHDDFRLRGSNLFQKVAFENYQALSYMHLYYDDSRRLTCRKL